MIKWFNGVLLSFLCVGDAVAVEWIGQSKWILHPVIVIFWVDLYII